MYKYYRLIVYLLVLVALLLNMFVINLPDGYYYIFNSSVFTFFVVSIFFIRSNFSNQTNTEKKVFIVVLLISILALIAQIGSINLLHSYSYRDLSILVFSIANLIAFFLVVFMYEIKT